MKKIIVVGATGKLGSVVVEGLKDYEVIRAGRSGPDLKIDALDFAQCLGCICINRVFRWLSFMCWCSGSFQTI